MSFYKNMRFACNNPEFRTKVFLFYFYRLAFWVLNLLYILVWSIPLLLFLISSKLMHLYEWGGQTLIYPLWHRSIIILYEVNETYFDSRNKGGSL